MKNKKIKFFGGILGEPPAPPLFYFFIFLGSYIERTRGIKDLEKNKTFSYFLFFYFFWVTRRHQLDSLTIIKATSKG